MKYLFIIVVASASASPPSRGAWIEIGVACFACSRTIVAPLAGGVD